MTNAADSPPSDAELARRSIIGFGEMLALLGRHAPASPAGAAREIRRPDAIGARIPAAGDNAWCDAVVVPPGVHAPADDTLPYCIWADTDAVPGHHHAADLVMPCMALRLADAPPPTAPGITIHTPPARLVGDMNDRAYGQPPTLAPLFAAVTDPRIHRYGIIVDGTFACVAASLAMGDDFNIHYVATDTAHRRKGLASHLITAMLAGARRDGFTTATLNASVDGFPVYQRLGFRTVGMLRGFVRETPR